MPAETSGRARARFDLKRTTFPLISLVLRTADLSELRDELQSRLGDSPDFFDQDLLVLNLAQLEGDGEEIDFAALVALLREYRVQPIGVHGGSPAQMRAAAEAGLVSTPEVSAATSMARSARSGGPREQPDADSTAAAPARTKARPKDDPPAAEQANAATPAQSPSKPAAVVIDKPLRSGQRVYAKGADLVVLDVVSFGAEVFADGNIHVYAPLRGRAVAGAKGDASARIFSTCLEPQLVAIAGVYRTIETPLPADVAGKPAQVRRVGDSLVIEPL